MTTRHLTKSVLTFAALTWIVVQPASAAPVFNIDINEGSSATAAGFDGLSAGFGTGAGSTIIDGITFSLFSGQGARNRGVPNDLTQDFAFDDGPGEAVGLTFGSAGDLAAGVWEVSVWSNDQTAQPNGPQIVGYRTNTVETIVSPNVAVNATAPAITFTFESDGVSAYDVFIRENNGNNRSRLNAVRLARVVPEPGTCLLASLGLACLVGLRRRRSRV